MELKTYDYLVGLLTSLLMVASPVSIKYTLHNLKSQAKRRSN